MASKQIASVTARDFLQKMKGRSQAALVWASDQHQYIVKWMHGPRATVSVRVEALRNAIFQYIGLPVSRWTPIAIDEDFIAAHPEMWIEDESGPVRPEAGVHFGSLMACDTHGYLFEVLPASMYERVRNRSDFWGAYVADVWTERFESRQAVFVRGDGPSDLRAIFIDHGSDIADMAAQRTPRLTSCLYPDRRIYLESEMIDDLHDWIDHIQRHGHAAINRAIESLPAEWLSPSIDSMALHFTERIGQLEEILFPSIACIPVTTRLQRKGSLSVRVLLRTCQIA